MFIVTDNIANCSGKCKHILQACVAFSAPKHYACCIIQQAEARMAPGDEQLEFDGRAKGGHARAAVLTAQQRKSIAKRAAIARWHSNIPRASHEGTMEIGGILLPCAVVEGRRLISERAVLRAFGLQPSGTTFKRATVSEATEGEDAVRLPMFVASASLRPFVDNELITLLTQPVRYYAKAGGVARRGLDATLIPRVCDVWLRARDAKALRYNQNGIAARADALMRGLAHTGIIALVDEATGYQEVRDRQALQAILDRFLSKELAAWTKRFPDEFYNEIFRLRGWQWERKGSRRPVQVANDTINLVYLRMLPDLLKELEERNPKDDRGRRQAKHHQFFSVDVGSPALNAHIHAVLTLMRAFDTWEEFKARLDRALPIVTRLSDLPLFSDPVATIESPQLDEQSPSAEQPRAS
jgi:hypothetical protein